MAYTSSSAQDRLDAVRVSIASVLSAQEYGIGGRRTRYAELKTLREMEVDLMAEVDGSSGTGFSTVAMVDRPT